AQTRTPRRPTTDWPSPTARSTRGGSPRPSATTPASAAWPRRSRCSRRARRSADDPAARVPSSTMPRMTAALSLGWIGTGVMGGPMAGHLLDRGHDVTVHNRTRRRAESLLEAGAQWRDTPAQVAAEADVVVTMLGTPADVRDVILGEGRVLESMREGSLLIDMTTSEPSLAVEIHETAKAKSIGAL